MTCFDPTPSRPPSPATYALPAAAVLRSPVLRFDALDKLLPPEIRRETGELLDSDVEREAEAVRLRGELAAGLAVLGSGADRALFLDVIRRLRKDPFRLPPALQTRIEQRLAPAGSSAATPAEIRLLHCALGLAAASSARAPREQCLEARLERALVQSAAWLIAGFGEDPLRSALALANPQLAGQLPGLALRRASTLADKRFRQAVQSLFRYFARACARPTAHGLFAGVQAIPVSNVPTARPLPPPASVTSGDPLVRPVWPASAVLVERVARPLLPDLRAYVNPTLRRQGEHFELWGLREHRVEQRRRLRAHPTVARLIELAADGERTVAELLAALGTPLDGAADPEALLRPIRALLAAQVLGLGVEALPFDTEPFAAVRQAMPAGTGSTPGDADESAAATARRKVDEVIAICAVRENAADGAPWPAVTGARIAERLGELGIDSRKILQPDGDLYPMRTLVQAELVLGDWGGELGANALAPLGEELADYVSLMLRIGASSQWLPAVVERLRVAGSASALDAGEWIELPKDAAGWRAAHARAACPATAVGRDLRQRYHELLRDRCARALAAGGEVVRLCRADVQALLGDTAPDTSEERLPPLALDVLIQLFAPGDGDRAWVLHVLSAPGWTRISRFLIPLAQVCGGAPGTALEALDAAFRRHAERLQQRYPDHLVAEVYCGHGWGAHLAARPCPFPAAIACHHGIPTGRQRHGVRVLPVADLDVSLGAHDQVEVRSRRLGVPVLPVYHGTLGTHCSPAATLLAESFMHRHAIPCHRPVLEPELVAGPRTPRLELGRVVLARQAWRFAWSSVPALDAAGGPLATVRAVRKWREQHGIPVRAYVCTAANRPPLLVDFENPLSLLALEKAALHPGAPAGPRVTVTEVLPEPEAFAHDLYVTLPLA
ncbi:MAG: lantibiotic dehydratase [Candidatus Schekmanbacteria bacterium]|nr:lantibiotic dehydratase [Candidatus Schekmanbacteria bacterium]